MWLTCGKSNNDPVIIAQNYIKCVAELGVSAMCLHTDCGTENGLMAAINCYWRSKQTDEFAGTRSPMYGTSTSNHRKLVVILLQTKFFFYILYAILYSYFMV